MASFKNMLVGFLCLASITFAGMTFSACGEKERTFNSASELYAFSAVSSINLLNSKKSQEPAQSGTATTDENKSEIVKKVNSYMSMVDGMLGGKYPITVKEETSEDETYAKKFVASVTHLDGQKQDYVLYYNEVVPTEENREAKDEDDFEVNTNISGIVKSGTEQYELVGEKEVEQDEIEVNLTIKLDGTNYIIITQETEKNEQEFTFDVFVNGESVENISIEVENENNETEIEVSTTYQSVTKVFKYEKEIKENDKVEIVITYQNGDAYETIVVTYVDGEQPTYKYAFSDNTYIDVEN